MLAKEFEKVEGQMNRLALTIEGGCNMNDYRQDRYFIVRCNRAGVFFGKIKEQEGGILTMADVRKLWYWSGACAVEQLAVDGTAEPGKCKFTKVVPEMIVVDAVQIIPCSVKAVQSLKSVEEWAV